MPVIGLLLLTVVLEDRPIPAAELIARPSRFQGICPILTKGPQTHDEQA
jgi:hypothetical protein